MKKSKDKIRLSFIGTNAEDVTGSMILVESPDFKFLIEAGLYQSNNILNDYRINSRKLPFKASEMDYIFIGHCHADHSLLIPRLVAEGFTGKIIAPKGTSKLFSVMAADSAYIMSKNVEALNRKYGMIVQPVYTDSDASDSLQYFEEYERNQKIDLTEHISFEFIPSGHIILGCQIKFWLKNKSHIKTIGYTGDLGNYILPKYYVNTFEPIKKCNVLIAESTYSDQKRIVGNKDREKDLEKIKSVVDDVRDGYKNKVLIPIFSLDRCQNIMTFLYALYSDDKAFDTPVLIDSPLAIKMCHLYSQLLEGEQLAKWNEVMSWGNFKFLKEYEESKAWMTSKDKCIILSASGFMVAGRSRQWAQVLLPDSKSHILFVGYSSENALASKIKNGGKQKTITIDGKAFANRCGVTDLKSFSGHIQMREMLDYYSSIDCEKVALVHSNFKSKCEFSKLLEDEISKRNRTGKVVCVNKSTSILL